MKNIRIIGAVLSAFLLSSCAVGPEYEKPTIVVAESYKEGKVSWRYARPNADMDRGEWWKIYNDHHLNELMEKLNKNNQNIMIAEATYRQSAALVEKARAAYFPSLNATHNITSQKTNEDSSATRATGKDTSSHSLSLDATWEADVWGATKYTVASDLASANMDKANLASRILSAQTSLAQYYFELRGVDVNQELLDSIVKANMQLLTYSKNNYKSGVMDEATILNYENSLHNAESAAYNNKITRGEYEHAIAILIGESPSMFKLSSLKSYKAIDVTIPVSMPSELLERRPDIARAEEGMKQANAQIGLAKTAYFPSLSITSSFAMSGDGLGNLLSMPNFVWSVGPQAALALFDGGARAAQTKSAWAGYEASVASYRQVILSAFGEVEDQLVSLKNLDSQSTSLNKAAKNSKTMLNISQAQYNSGIIDQGQIFNTQISYYNAKKSAMDVDILKRSAEIGLIKALGGDWSNNIVN